MATIKAIQRFLDSFICYKYIKSSLCKYICYDCGVKLKKWHILGIIFIIALVVRFCYFKQNIYFGFDEARDALVAENIYLKGDFKLIGPPASGDTGLFHGPAYWYLVGPLYVLSSGNLYVVSAIFRLINALGIFLVFAIAKKIFSKKAAYIAAFLYAISFEQSQYAIYFSKEALALICWLMIMLVVVSIYKKESRSKIWGLPIIAACFGLMIQFNIIYAGYGVGLMALFFLILPQLKQIKIKSWILAGLAFVLTLSTYIVEELKYNFREIRAAVGLMHSGFGIMSPGQSKYSLFWDKYLTMFRDNVVGLSFDINWQRIIIAIVAIIFTGWLIFNAIRDKRYAILLVWLLTWVGIMLAGGHMAYYTNVALSVSILIGVAVILDKIGNKNFLVWGILLAIVISNGLLIYGQRDMGLITSIKPQPFMNLVDERKIIDQMYTEAAGRGFTLRLTGIPYRIQTVWYYLLNEYGYKKYGYFPYWEDGNVLGYPGASGSNKWNDLFALFSPRTHERLAR